MLLPNASVSGSDTSFSFKNSLNSSLWTVAGKVGIPLGAVRLYVQVGADRHQATSTTTQIINDRSYTADDGTVQTVTGGTQTFVLRTAGWGVLFGGGIEVWVKPKFGIYAEAERDLLRGADRDGGEGRMNDQLTAFRIGVRIRLLGH